MTVVSFAVSRPSLELQRNERPEAHWTAGHVKHRPRPLADSPEPELIWHNLSLSVSLSFFHLLLSGYIHHRLPTRMSSSSRVVLFPKIRHTSALCYASLDVNVLWMDLRQAVYSERVRGEILCGFALTYQKQLWNPRHWWHMLHSECIRAAHLSRKSRTKRILEKLPSEEQLLKVTNISLALFFLLLGRTNEWANDCMFESFRKVKVLSGNNEKIHY